MGIETKFRNFNREDLQLIDRDRVCKLLGISIATLLRLEKAGSFVRRVYLSPRRIAYSLVEVKEWIESRSL